MTVRKLFRLHLHLLAHTIRLKNCLTALNNYLFLGLSPTDFSFDLFNIVEYHRGNITQWHFFSSLLLFTFLTFRRTFILILSASWHIFIVVDTQIRLISILHNTTLLKEKFLVVDYTWWSNLISKVIIKFSRSFIIPTCWKLRSIKSFCGKIERAIKLKSSLYLKNILVGYS